MGLNNTVYQKLGGWGVTPPSGSATDARLWVVAQPGIIVCVGGGGGGLPDLVCLGNAPLSGSRERNPSNFLMLGIQNSQIAVSDIGTCTEKSEQ